MTRFMLAALVALSVAGCGRLNPFGGAGETDEVMRPDTISAEIPDDRPLVPALAGIEVEPDTTGAAIVRATAAIPRPGYWKAALIPLPQTDPGVLRLAFVANPPTDATPLPAPDRVRRITAAYEISPRDLFSIREIVVLSEQNAQTIRR
ncbi:hypothetical protein PAA8504_01529 [Palleronia abyssalis]|uniref:Lipoprotein n=2 Tax=Palleronia abyssalis TaxID=1501240 RepID=A0A2R8BU68_9RHOB|nr:hypothetical protein PAA8504_01529 [Palleronia abyssalis]